MSIELSYWLVCLGTTVLGILLDMISNDACLDGQDSCMLVTNDSFNQSCILKSQVKILHKFKDIWKII